MMNQQFLPIFHPTPKFVPVVVRSNAPVGFTESYNPSTCYHIPVFPGHASPDTKFTPTTSKTRRDLEQLGSPTDDKTLSEVIFELAAQKNGIRIGSVPNIGGVHVVKQTASNSLEEFKKIAERNGITVYQAGSNRETESISTDDDSKGMLAAVNKEPMVDTEEDVSEIEKFAEIFVAEVQNEMDVNMANGDYLEKKAGKSDIKVKDSTDLVKRSSCSNQSGDFEEAICVNSNYCVVDSKSGERLPAINDHVSKATNKTTIEDAQIAAFQNIASQKGIKVGTVSNKINCNDYYSSVDAGDSVSVSEVNKAKVVSEAVDLTEQDLKIARFQEMARLNGIKVGGGEVDTNGRKISSNSCPEYFDSGSGESSQQNECYLDAERDPQILRFQELAWMNGIKVGTTSAPSPSYSSLSSCDSDDQSSSQFVDKWPIMVQNCLDRKSDAFQEATERIGIKHKETSAIAKSVANACGLVAPFANASAEASTQTEVAVHVDCHTQTQDKDSEISRLSTGVQVSATKEAFQEEHLLWKLDDDNKVEAEAALCYKDLYLSESKKAEKLGADLQDKKDLLVSLRHNHKRVMDEIKEELNTKLKECEELKKELKASRRLKENEIKRISKELKSRQEELEASHANLQIKEVVVESLRQIAQEQTAKIKVLEEELQDLKQASSKVQENQECKACSVKEQDTENLEGNVDNRNKVQNDDDDDDDDDNGWTVIARKKSKSPLKKQKNTKNIKSGSISQLCEIDLDDCIKRESIGHVFSDPKMHSIDTGSVSIDSTSQVSLEDDTNCRDSTLVSKVGESNGECQYNAVDEDNTTGGTNKFTSSCPQTLQQDAFCNVDNNAKVQRVAEGSNAQQASLLSYPCTLPSQPHPFPSVPLEVFTQYLSNQLQTPRSVPQVKNSRSVCRPPGLNTEPVPEGEIPCQQTTPLSAPAGKFSSFDKLMVALQKRFPSKDRQELIVYLKKAKAACGAAGFKGMQILDVVKCVEETVELKENKMP